MAKTTQDRLRKRGTALVEAAIVAPVFAMFWLMMIHISGVYQYKIETAQEARYQAFYRATNGCAKSGSASAGAPWYHTNGTGDDSGGQTSTQTNDNSTDLSKGGNIPGAGGVSNNSKLIAKGTSTATWKYNAGNTVPYTGGTFTVTTQDVKTESYVLCNEVPSGINPISYLGGLVSTITSSFPP